MTAHTGNGYNQIKLTAKRLQKIFPSPLKGEEVILSDLHPQRGKGFVVLSFLLREGRDCAFEFML